MNILKYIRKKKHILFKRKWNSFKELKEKIAKEASLFISYIDFLLLIIILLASNFIYFINYKLVITFFQCTRVEMRMDTECPGQHLLKHVIGVK